MMETAQTDPGNTSNSAEILLRARWLAGSKLLGQTFKPAMEWALGHKLTLNKLKIYLCQKIIVKNKCWVLSCELLST